MSSLLFKIKDGLKRRQNIYMLVRPIYKTYRRVIMRGAQLLFGINPKKVVFSSFRALSYSDNPRYVSEKLHELCPDCEIVWLFAKRLVDKVETPDYVKKRAVISHAGLFEQATARFWVDNFKRSETFYLNSRKQYYINTWHGDRGFKRVGDDNEKIGLKKMYRLEDRCAMMIAGSEFGRNNYRTAFHFKGEVLMDGCPRNDILVRNDPAEAAAMRARLGIPEGVRLLMYAPTYRDPLERSQAKQDAVLDIPRTLDFLEAHTGETWRCLYRTHYLSGGLNTREDPRVMDATGWPDMSELLLVTDMLITDYSSCGGDFALLRRPLFLYQPDVEEYLRDSRSFYIDMETSPFLVAHSMEELEKLIAETDAQKARENCEALDAFFGTTETGHATEAVCRYIMDRMD